MKVIRMIPETLISQRVMANLAPRADISKRSIGIFALGAMLASRCHPVLEDRDGICDKLSRLHGLIRAADHVRYSFNMDKGGNIMASFAHCGAHPLQPTTQLNGFFSTGLPFSSSHS